MISDEGADGVECCRKVVCGRRVQSSIRFPVKAKSLQLECARVLCEGLLVPLLIHGIETTVWGGGGKI